jgi:hypothetical protein
VSQAGRDQPERGYESDGNRRPMPPPPPSGGAELDLRLAQPASPSYLNDTLIFAR